MRSDPRAPEFEPARPSRRGRLVAALGAGGAVAVVAALLVLNGHDEPNASEQLAAAQAFVADAESFRFDFDIAGTSVEGQGRGASESIDRSGGDGEWSRSGWWFTSDDAWSHTEVTLVGDQLFARYSDGDEPFGQWDAYPAPPPPAETRQELLRSLAETAIETETDIDALLEDEYGVGLSASLYMGLGSESYTFSGPAGFLDLVASLSDPTITNRDGASVTLESRLEPPAEFVEAYGQPLPVGIAQLDLRDGVPVAVRLHVSEGGVAFDIEVRVSRWDEPISVAVPGDDEVDRTPWVEEEEIIASGLPAFAPTALTEGWDLVSIDVIEVDAEWGQVCAELNLAWVLEGVDGDLDPGLRRLPRPVRA